MQPDISLVILNYNQLGLTRECVKNFKAHETHASLEIIVVDNSNDRHLRETLEKRYPDVVYIPIKKNNGYAAGNNEGIKASTGRYVAIVNPDITPFPGSLDALIDYMDAHKDVGIAGPRLYNPDGSVQQSYYRFHSLLTPVYRRLSIGKLSFGKRHLDKFLMADIPMDTPRDVDWLLGACLFVRRSALQEVGNLDERFFVYFEDTDWCRRFWSYDWKVRYVPAAEMLHLHLRESAHTMGLKALFQPSTRIHIYSAIKYFLKQWKGGYIHVKKTQKEQSN